MLARQPRSQEKLVKNQTKKRADTALLSDRFQSGGEIDTGDFSQIPLRDPREVESGLLPWVTIGGAVRKITQATGIDRDLKERS